MKVVESGRSHSVTAVISVARGVNFVHLLRLVNAEVSEVVVMIEIYAMAIPSIHEQ